MFTEDAKLNDNEMSRVELRRHGHAGPWTYAMLDARQRTIAEEIRRGGVGRLLLSEVAPVITLGRRAREDHLLLTQEDLNRLGIDLYRTDRGGLETYHGPGQWVLFTIDFLENLNGNRRGVREFVNGLLEVALHVGSDFGIRNLEIRSGGEVGLWSPRGKVASVGLKIDRGIVLHGLAVNGFESETSFYGLKPCGLDCRADFLFDSPERFLELGWALVSTAQKYFWRSCRR